MGFDATGLLGNLRSHRYAMVVTDGVVEALEQVR
jgi:peroxiredoxin